MLKPKDIVEWSERHRLYTPGPMQQLSMQQPPIDQPQQYPQLYSQQLPERQIPTQTSVQYLPTNHMSMQTYFHEPAEHELSRIPRHEAIVLHKAPPPAEAGYTSDNCCNYPRKTEIVHLRTSGTSQRTQKPDSTDSDECCCSCDEEPCDCNCCCCLDVSKKGIQTSQFCFRENCTQTDKVKRKRRCCR